MNSERNEDLFDMKYVVKYLCPRNVTVVNLQGGGGNERYYVEWE